MRYLLVCVALCSATAAQAADPVPKPDPAKQLAQLVLRTQEGEAAAKENACPPDRTAFSEKMKRDYLNMSMSYGGISPQSYYWPEVEELFYQFRSAQCPNTKSPVDTFAETVSKEMSTAEIDAAIAFYGSAEGKRVLAGVAKAQQAVQGAMFQRSAQGDAAGVAYREGLRELIARYKADPR
ncbi:DUF2059 domain-containing protein [Massilia sp. R2A-15]|uniref:DUF2059 domain-containing protein n=1 Tax=Massilia sp. R2A-15 TaxID=3064278 RepID=UPI002733757F|nr:DUF2059 domain-containing protein [Massilia sp. R2A-15]WLI90008.1 DUF2059 domain-containing protein [Massilia sp. R2A-15]